MTRFTLTSGAFISCSRVGAEYKCSVGDSNYFFTSCDSIIFESCEKLDPNEIGEIIKNLCFVYEVDGKKVVEPVEAKLTFRSEGSGICHREEHILAGSCICNTYRFDCDIKRPSRLTVNKYNPKRSATKINLVFSSEYNIGVQFFVNSSHIDNHREKGIKGWVGKHIF